MGALTRTRDKAYWESKNLILGASEVGFEDETGKSKIGDGITRWNSLPYTTYSAFLIPQEDFELIPTENVSSRRNLPGRGGLLTAYSGTAPTVTVGAANGVTSISSPLYVGYEDAHDPHMSLFGTQLAFATDDPNTSTIDSVVPADGNSFQSYRVGTVTDAPKIEFNFRGVGSAYRVWIDGHPLSLVASTLPGGGAFYWISIDFAGVRKVRTVEVEIDSGHFSALAVAAGDLAMPAPKAGPRGVILGDSFVEGVGADARFTSWPWTFGQLCGWVETIAAGSGGTGYLSTGSPTYTGRATYRSRFHAVVTAHDPDVVIISGGRNDIGPFTAAQIGAEASLLFTHAKAELPDAQLVIVGPAPSTDSQVTAFQAASDAIKEAALSAGAIFLDTAGSNAYITATTHLTGGDGVHPTQAGHDALAFALFQRYAAQLPI